MAKILDLGCGYEKERQLPGADLCNCNMDIDEVDLEEGRRFFNIFASQGEPLPVPDGTYDLIWYTSGWYSCFASERRSIAQEITRVAKPRATLVLRDYTMITTPKGDITITPRQWMWMVKVCFREWSVDAFYVEVALNLDDSQEKVPHLGEYPGAPEGAKDHSMCAILTKGWG